MAEQGSADKFRSIKAFKDFEQRSQSSPRSLGVDAAVAVAEEVSTLRVLAAVKRRGDGVRRSELARELHATPEAVETAVLRLLKEGLVTIKAGSGPDDVLIAAEVDAMTTLGSQDKAYLFGFYLLDLVGEEFLAGVLEKYKDDFTTAAP